MRIIAATLAGAVAPYAFFAFVAWNADVVSWPPEGRFGLVMLSGVGAVFAWLMASDRSL